MMFGRKRRLREAEALVDQLQAQIRELKRKHAAQLETAEHTAVTACRHVDELARQVADLRPAVIRLHGRNKTLTARLEAREDSGSDADYVTALENRVWRLQRACGRWMGAAWAAQAETRRARREAEDIRRPYEQRLADTQAVSELQDWRSPA